MPLFGDFSTVSKAIRAQQAKKPFPWLWVGAAVGALAGIAAFALVGEGKPLSGLEGSERKRRRRRRNRR